MTTRDDGPETTDDISTRGALSTYRREKLLLGGLLVDLLNLTRREEHHDLEEQVRALAAKLAEDRFELAVVGQFSRGKSTLMNALLGGVFLPAGALPTTSAVTTVRYASTARATVKRVGALPIEVDVANLANYVARAPEPGDERAIEGVEVELPAELLRLGFCFVDTPGVGSAIEKNTETTRAFLPSADAVVFVTSYDSALTEAETEFLSEVRDTLERIFVVINKSDLVQPEEASAVRDFVARRLSDAGLEKSALFSCSARDGLSAKLARDTEALRTSGLSSLESALVSYLTGERSAEFLSQIATRALRLVGALSTTDPALSELSKALVEARGRVLSSDSAPSPRGSLDASVQSSSRRSGCAVCSAVVKALFEFVAHYQYELESSMETRQAHADAGGFCGLHTWYYAEVSSSVGISIAYVELAERLSAELSSSADGPVGELASRVLALQSDNADCPACRQVDRVERGLIEQIAGLSDEVDEPSLCLVHLESLLESGPSEKRARRVLESTAELLSRRAEDMRSFALKRQALRRGLVDKTEASAARDVLLRIAGDELLHRAGNGGRR